jgi:hypothetical protein
MSAAVVVVDGLFHAGQHLSPADHAAVIALGGQVVPLLLEMLEDETLLLPEARGHGWAPVHAARLLGELRAPVAIPRLLEIVCKFSFIEDINQSSRKALKAMGPVAFEACLAEYQCCRDWVTRNLLMEVILEHRVKDERLFDILRARFDENPLLFGSELAEYGDPRAVPWLAACLDANQVTPNAIDHVHNLDLVELAKSIEALGGTLTEEQARKRADALGQWHAAPDRPL